MKNELNHTHTRIYVRTFWQVYKCQITDGEGDGSKKKPTLQMGISVLQHMQGLIRYDDRACWNNVNTMCLHEMSPAA